MTPILEEAPSIPAMVTHSVPSLTLRGPGVPQGSSPWPLGPGLAPTRGSSCTSFQRPLTSLDRLPSLTEDPALASPLSSRAPGRGPGLVSRPVSDAGTERGQDGPSQGPRVPDPRLAASLAEELMGPPAALPRASSTPARASTCCHPSPEDLELSRPQLSVQLTPGHRAGPVPGAPTDPLPQTARAGVCTQAPHGHTLPRCHLPPICCWGAALLEGHLKT